MISFLITILCCSDYSIFEGYSEEEEYKMKFFKDSILKYDLNMNPQHAGSINFNNKLIQEEKNEEKKEEKKEKKKYVYSKLRERATGDYMPYEAVLPDEFQEKRIQPTIKGDGTKVEPDIDSPSLLKGMPKAKKGTQDVKQYSDKF